jgi:hypothetical protein
VVVDREALRLRLGQLRETPRAGIVEISSLRGADVPGDVAGSARPAEVVGGGDVREEVEAGLVPKVQARLAQARRVDDERRLIVGIPSLDQPGDALVRQEAAPRIS